MADFYADGPEARNSAHGAPVGRAGGAMRLVVNSMGALISVALVVGIGVWGYKMVVRDVSGVPVVRASEGPLRVQPDDPGGRTAAHQGLAVNAVAADGAAAAPADRLTLAPAPVELTDEDAPGAALPGAVATDATDLPADRAEATAAATADAAGSVDALVAQLMEGATALGAPPPEQEAQAEPAVASAAEAQTGPRPASVASAAEAQTGPRPASVASGGLGVSLRPVPRPASLTVARRSDAGAASPAAAAAGAVGLAREVDADSIPDGTRLAQLGAFDSPEVARAEWQRLETRFSDFLAGKDRVIQRAESGGRTFYRLRAMGFEDLADARRFCAALVAEKADCIPVVTR